MKRYDEIEIKLKVLNRRDLKKRVKALGFTESAPRVHERNVLYDFPDGFLTRRRCALRLRSAGGRHWVTFKGKPSGAQKYKIREEIETSIGDGEQLSRIFRALGLLPVFTYEKHRTTYIEGPAAAGRKQPTLSFDETSAGDYIELEGPQGWIDHVASQLGFDEGEYITASYVSLLSGQDQEFRGRRETPGALPPGVLASIGKSHSKAKKA
ncbi:MAG TPA: class IV adenylate cyclase [Terriglobia bacterium]|nr:class IV adenylate cyclase [Terriglobia bacterium]